MKPFETSAIDPGRLTDVAYWNRSWVSTREGPARGRRLRRLARLDQQLAGILLGCVRVARLTRPRVRVLEAGCANSTWLPFLARETGCEVMGVDFSERGCRLAERNLGAMNVPGTIVCEDLFAFARSAAPDFDVVMSFGLVEHFEDADAVMAAMAGLLRPGGVFFASVPNLAGVYGPLQRAIDQQVYERHVVLTPDDLAARSARAGLVEVETGFVGGPLRLSALNVGHVAWMPMPLSRLVARGLFETDSAVAAFCRAIGRREARPATAPYVYVRGKRPA